MNNFVKGTIKNNPLDIEQISRELFIHRLLNKILKSQGLILREIGIKLGFYFYLIYILIKNMVHILQNIYFQGKGTCVMQ